jgi:hypothetical protein
VWNSSHLCGLKKSEKKNQKKLAGNKKRCIFALPFDEEIE